MVFKAIVLGIVIEFIIFTCILLFLWDKMRKLEEMDRRICARLDSMLNCEVMNHNAVMRALNPDNQYLAEQCSNLEKMIYRNTEEIIVLQGQLKGIKKLKSNKTQK